MTVAEHAVWTAMALLRRNPQVDGDLRGTGWSAGRAHSDHGRELSGKTLGILGLGNIGRALARMAVLGFGMQVLAHTRNSASLPDGVQAADFPALLDRSDILVLSAPLTVQTRGMVDRAAIARMKPGAILVNVARGPLIDEAALIEALRSGHLGGGNRRVRHTTAARGSPLVCPAERDSDPHMAGVTEESMLRMGQGVVAETRRVLAGDLPLNLINPEAVADYRARFAV